MFEDSLVESTGRIRTRSRYFAMGSFVLQTLLLVLLALYPFLHPAILPEKSLSMLITAPPLPASPANLPQHAAPAANHPQPMQLINPLQAPMTIPRRVDTTPGPPPSALDSGLDRSGTGRESGIFETLSAMPSTTVKPAPLKGPVHVSSGVAAGQLITPIQPVYPAIARTARIQGTVVVQAVISKTGSIEQIRVLSGPAMLQGAAVEAIRRARYRPFTLNGEPVEVETTINVIFTLGNGG